MNPFEQALLTALQTLVTSTVTAIVPVLVGWFQKLVVPITPAMQAMSPKELRDTAHAWVSEALNEIGAALVTKGVIPAWLQGFLPPLELSLVDAISSALDAAGL